MSNAHTPNKALLLFVLLDADLTHHADMIQVSEFLVVIQAKSYDEFVWNVESDEIFLHILVALDSF
jgi:hypothetical protein